MSNTEARKLVKLLAISSGGGHWMELRRIMPAFDGFDVAYASIFPDYSNDVHGERFYSFPDFSRFNKISIFVLIHRLLKILWAERPQVIITTGSAPALISLALGRFLFGSKTIWIDSLANCEQLSTSGRVACRVAHVCLTQWPHLSNGHRPGYWGAVL